MPKVKFEQQKDIKFKSNGKKDHEAQLLAKYVLSLIKSNQAAILDIGCGKGYLAFEINE